MTASPAAGTKIYPDPPGGSPTDLNIILTVTERRRESTSGESVFLRKPAGFEFDPGDWLDIRFPTAELAVGRTYSFASSPTEADLRITYKRGISSFKKALQVVRPGDTLLVTQTGSNGFLLDHSRPAILIAGGVGVAPFRSMIKEAIDYGDRPSISLLYIDRTDEDFIFRDELDRWARESPSLRVTYVATRREGRLSPARLRAFTAETPAAAESLYYVAGPPAMVTSSEALLTELGISQHRVRSDRFDGY